MCLVGGTRIPLLSGKDESLEALATGERTVVYACTRTGRVVTAYCQVSKSETATEGVLVELDNGASIGCASTQQFLGRDGTDVAAGDLHVSASVMPLYTKRDKDGYVLVQQNYSGRWQKAHWIVARSGLLGPIPRFEGQRTIIHHRNFDEADNRPENLEFMGANDHSVFHRSLVERNEYWQSPEFEARRIEALGEKAKTPEGHAYFAERGRKNIVKYMEERPEHFRASVAGNGARGAPVLANYNSSDRGRAKSREMASRMHRCELCGEEVRSYIGLHNHRKYRHGYNHLVVGVRPTSEPTTLYCVTMAEHEHVAVSAGVFLRTCSSGDFVQF
ncbi:MAG: hypothetical protein HOV81_27170 [Kofleriaceae bacterium]|nr:hypothetical protein [Kofleriaceae bacterium]